MQERIGQSYLEFNARVDRAGGPMACWPWTGYRTPKGYGVTLVVDKQRKAHRRAWSAANGGIDIPPGMVVMHDCDNPPCCNPLHLRLGTVKDNNRDAAKKGRKPDPIWLYHEPGKAGEVREALLRDYGPLSPIPYGGQSSLARRLACPSSLVSTQAKKLGIPTAPNPFGH